MMAHVRDRNEQSGGFPDLAVDAQIDRLIGFNQEEVTGASLTLVSVGGETQKIAFSGKLGGGDLSLNYAVAPNGTTLDGSAADGGRLCASPTSTRAWPAARSAISGEAGRGPGRCSAPWRSTTSTSSTSRRWSAMVGRRDRRRRRASIRAASISTAWWRASARPTASSSSRMRCSPARRSARPSPAATTCRRPACRITGTYLPAYAFNNLFSRIPLLGLALGGGMREGLIGVTFKIDGPIAQPQVFFNPLSAVAPGIFRKIFEFQRRRSSAATVRPALTSTCFLRPSESFDHAVGVEVGGADRSRAASVIADVVDAERVVARSARRTSPFEPARPARTKSASDGDAGGEFGARDRRSVGSASPSAAFLEGAARRLGRLVRRVAAVEERGRLGGEHLLRLVDLGAVERREPRDLVERQLGEELEEAADVGVLGVPPELPVLVGREQVGVEPDRAAAPSCPSWRRTRW